MEWWSGGVAEWRWLEQLEGDFRMLVNNQTYVETIGLLISEGRLTETVRRSKIFIQTFSQHNPGVNLSYDL
jgi:hypothetical protein